MKLSIRIPLLIGSIVLFTSAGIGLVASYISATVLEKTLLEAMQSNNNSNAELLSATLNGKLAVLGEIAKRSYIRNMDWDLVQQELPPDINRFGAVDLALTSSNGMSRYVQGNAVIDVHDREYFKQAMKGEHTIEVVPSRLDNKIMVLFASPIFRDAGSGSPVIGALIASLDGEKALSEIMGRLSNATPSGYHYLIDKSGTIIAHHDTDLVSQQFNPINAALFNPSIKEWGNSVAGALRTRNGISRYAYNGTDMIGQYTEVPGYPWILVSAAEQSDINRELANMRSIILIAGIIFILAGIIAAFIIGRLMVKPVVRIADTLAHISAGDFAKRIDLATLSSHDELQDLSRNFNASMDNVKDLVQHIQSEAQTLSNVSNDLAHNMNETASAVNQITANIDSIKGRIIGQSSNASQTHAIMEEVVDRINKLNDHVEDQSDNITQASSAIEQMIANTQSVTDTLIKNDDNVQHLLSAAEVGRTGLHEVAADIQEIAEKSEGLMQINSVMNSIASKTNLLSMNAAIEAAHAGESGKGFGVVADEIRKLAESSSDQSKIIGTVLNDIKELINKITASTKSVLGKFEGITSSVKTVAMQEENIRCAMEEQGEGSKQILAGVSNVRTITRQVRHDSGEMLNEANEVIHESEDLEKATHEIALGINEMVTGAAQINKAIHHVNEISAKNRDGINILLQEVSRFKVEDER